MGGTRKAILSGLHPNRGPASKLAAHIDYKPPVSSPSEPLCRATW